MKKNSKGFTLIELLAIIVILAIIAVITVPIILNIIENSRKGAATDSAYGYKDSVNKTYVAELQNHNKLKLDGTYTVKSDGSLEPTTDNTFGFGDSEYGNSLNVAVSGTIPSSGKLRYANNVLNAGCLVIGDYKITFGIDGKVDGTIKGDCSTYEFPTDNANNNQNSGNGQEEPVEQNESAQGGSTPNANLPKYFAFGNPTTTSSTSYPEETVFGGLYENGDKAVCLNVNGEIECFKDEGVSNNIQHFKNVFGETYYDESEEQNVPTCSGGDCISGYSDIFYCSFYADSSGEYSSISCNNDQPACLLETTYDYETGTVLNQTISCDAS